MRVLVIATIRCGGTYFAETIANNHNLDYIHEPKYKNLGATNKNNVVVKILTHAPFTDIEEIVKYSKNFDRIYVLDRKDKEEQLRSVYSLYEYPKESAHSSYHWDDSMFEKENPKDTKEEYESWINKFTKQVNTIASILDKDILYYEDLYYGKIELEDIKFMPDTSERLRKEPIKIEYRDSSFNIKELPLDRIYVFDNYLENSLWKFIDTQLTRSSTWAKTNQVNSQHKTGLPHHSFWGTSILRADEEGNGYLDYDAGWTESSGALFRWFNRRICTDFGFKWKRFQYMGTNSQTQGLEGTTHADCQKEDEWNLSFLYYYNSYWNSEWGGDLRFYDDVPQQGRMGREEHIKNHQIGSVEFVPNRLVMFDGRIPHGADAPNSKARYMDRRSIVLRGDEVQLVDEEEMFNANDRFYNI